MRGEVSFDTLVGDVDQNHIEGCYRIAGGEWLVFYFTHRANGAWWQGEPVITKDAVFGSGILGVDALLPTSCALNKKTVMETLSSLFGVEEWAEVRGPDSINLK